MKIWAGVKLPPIKKEKDLKKFIMKFFNEKVLLLLLYPLFYKMSTIFYILFFSFNILHENQIKPQCGLRNDNSFFAAVPEFSPEFRTVDIFTMLVKAFSVDAGKVGNLPNDIVF